jgi:hypothetical protein
MNDQEFHIHIDAKNINSQFEKILVNKHEFGYKNFIKRQDLNPSYAPETHLTYKTTNPNQASQIFKDIHTYLEQNPDSMTGYVEHEYIPDKISIEYRTFNPDVPLPFQLELGNLAIGAFREDEIHITLDRDNSDRRLLESLRQIGFFSALRQKDYGIAEIFTTQGSYQDIQKVLPMIVSYLNQAGGAAACVVKEERIIHSWVSSLDYKLPPVIKSIQTSSIPQLATQTA